MAVKQVDCFHAHHSAKMPIFNCVKLRASLKIPKPYLACPRADFHHTLTWHETRAATLVNAVEVYFFNFSVILEIQEQNACICKR